MLGRRRRALRIIAVAIVLLLPVVAVFDLSRSGLWKPMETFDNTFDLMYASKGMMFNTQTLDTRGNMGPYTSIELDSSGYPHISYYDETRGDLRYIRRTGSGWLIDIVDSDGDVGLYTSLELDRNDRPHISYYKKSTGDLRYAVYDGDAFDLITVDSLRDTGLYTSLALDSNDTPCISYYEKGVGALKFAKLNGTEWETDFLDNVGDVGLYTSIGLDPDDNPSISYYDKTLGDLKYMEWNGTAWEAPRTIDSKGDVGLYTSLAVGDNGAPYVSYFDKTNGDLKFATFERWTMFMRTLDSSGVRGLYTSLALDSGGQAHISYYDKTMGDLRYATGMGFRWQIEDPVNEGDTGKFSSIAVDVNNRPHISFAGPSILESTDPALGMDCEREDTCSYVHMVWMESEESARSAYQRIYYQRSVDKGKTWSEDVRPISSAWKHFAGYPNILISGEPAISVVGKTVHVAWAHEYQLGFNSRGGVFYQRSDDNGDTWLNEEVRIDDIPSSASIPRFPSSVGIHADDDYVNVVWQYNAKIYSTRSHVNGAHTSDGWRSEFGEYGSVAVDATGRVFITSFDKINGDLLISASPGNGEFDTKIIDRIGKVGLHTSVDLYSGNYPYPRVAYYDETKGNLKYADWNGTDWMIDEVDTSGNVGLYASLSADSNGRPHIAYYDMTKGDLKLAKWNGTNWLLETVDYFGDVGQFASLDLDGDDNPHISYYNATGRELKLASWNSIQWNIQVVDDSADVGKYSSLEMDSTNNPHISYFDETNSHLVYAHHSGSAWEFELPDASDQVGQYTSIALDSNEKPVISYFDVGKGQLKYVRRDTQDWTSEVLDSIGIVGKHTSIAMDNSDGVHISYFDETNQRMRYYSTNLPWLSQSVQRDEMLSYPLYGVARTKYGTARYPQIDGENGDIHVVFQEMATPKGDLKFAQWNGTDWRVETVDEDGVVGLHTSLALDSKENPHICYYDLSGARLKYARWDGTDWKVEMVDDFGDVGRECSLALDSKDSPHIIYVDMWNGLLKYARRESESWTIGLVGDVSPAAGRYNSLVLDSMDRPHVAYFSWAGSAMHYAYYNGERWQFSHVDSKGWKQISLALDSNDQPHMAYNDRPQLAAKYTYWNGAEWVKRIVDESSSYVGTYASIVLTPEDRPILTYYDEKMGDLRLARLEYPLSNTARVDRTNKVGMYNSLALDDYGIAHMSYYDSTEGDLKYAKWVPGGFSIESVDTYGDVGLYTSIKLDPNGYPRISYYDESNGNGLYHIEGPADGIDPWTSEVLVHEKIGRWFLGAPAIDVEGGAVHVVWDEYDEHTTLSEIHYKRSDDGGTTWPFADIKISDDPRPGGILQLSPQVQASGATVHVLWLRQETVGVGQFNSELMYDMNRVNGEPSGWGTDLIASPDLPHYPRYQALMPSVRVVGNDRHIVWLFWDGNKAAEIKYFRTVDNLSNFGELGDGRKGSASVYVVNPVALKNEIIVVGGETQSGFSDRVTRVDLGNGAVQDYCNLPNGLAYASAVWDENGSVFVFGGLSSTGAEASILRVNLTTTVPGDMCTDTGITLGSGRYGTSAVYNATSDTAYIFGGTDGTGTYLADIVKWPRLGVATSFGALPSERTFTSAVWDSAQNKAFVFGGSGPSGHLDEIVGFRDSAGSPEVRVILNGKLPTPRSATSSAFDGSYAYIFGGNSVNGSLSEIVRFNPRGDWKTGVEVMCPMIPQGLENSSAVMTAGSRSYFNGIFVVGGSNETTVSGGIWKYRPSYWGFSD
jgi:hypothetical protein